jgi:hypothetical protein
MACIGKTFTFYTIYKSSINELMRRDSRPCSCLINAPPFQHIYQLLCARQQWRHTVHICCVCVSGGTAVVTRIHTYAARLSKCRQTPTQRHLHLAAITISKQTPFIIQHVDIPPHEQTLAPYRGLTLHPKVRT